MSGPPPFDLAVAITAFIPLLLLELPDKTFIATLVLASRFRPAVAWVGVGLAFGVQCAIAVAAGGLLSRLPESLVAAAAAVLFAVGAVLLWRDSRSIEPPVAPADDGPAPGPRTPVLRAVATSFAVVFVAEWGDLSQLFTAGLAARSADPVSVFVGAWTALLVVAGLAATLGAVLANRLPLRAVRLAGAGVCALLAVLAAAQALGAPVPF